MKVYMLILVRLLILCIKQQDLFETTWSTELQNGSFQDRHV